MMENQKWKQDLNLWPQVLQATALLTRPPVNLKTNALKIDFNQKEYNILSYSFQTCTKQALCNYKMPVKIW